MISESGDGLVTLWASSGSPADLASATAVRRWLLPASKQVEVVSVAPVSSMVTRRMMHWTAQQRAQDMLEAGDAANRSLDALGETGVPPRVHLRWGTPNREIVLQADECHADVIALGPGAPASLRKSVLGSTAQQVLFDTMKSVFLAREGGEADGPVIVLYTSQRVFSNAVVMLRALRVHPDVPVCLLALLDPVKPFGSMFLTLNEEIRAREQASHDVQAGMLRDYLGETARDLRDAGHSAVTVAVHDCDAREMPSEIEKMQPALVIAGDSAPADLLGDERRHLGHLATRLAACVLVAR